ncbi:MAG: coenzyme F420-0:L-glutamate ligase [Candidatus Gottesmanbacteria bacterium]|nr:coenzyme F420-0:L-glutamate ligase [Candidatus Gottesmanbacteria bacterium]
MEVTAIKTKPILPGDELLAILDQYLPKLHEGDILAVTSKIVSICEQSLVKNDGQTDKLTLIKQEADRYLDLPLSETYGMTITIKNHKLVANSGIDESNGNGYFILWPRNPFESAAMIWTHVQQKSHLKNIGVIVTDTHVDPLQWGTLGRSIAWCGIEPLKNYIGTPDIFGKNLHATKASVIDSLAAAAVSVMGEGNEQTPLALIRNFPFASYLSRPPNQKEIQALEISLDDDMYAPLLTSVKWKKGS